MLTREEIIARLNALERYTNYFCDEGDGCFCDGMETDRNGDFYSRNDILAIIEEAESE